MNDSHDHDHGLRHDLPRLLNRRRMIGLLGMGAGLGFASPSVAADVLSCVIDPRETEGPYPADGTNAKAGQTVNVLTQEGVIREDIRTSFAGQIGEAEGTRFDMEFQLVNANNGCAPVSGYALYIWHCDTEGHYSLYDLPQQNYLRGVGISDADGIVKFTTIFPGCYDGRWPHIHFEVFANPDDIVTGRDSLLISQTAMPYDACTAVYAQGLYGTSADNLTRQSLSRDMVFSDSTDAEMAQRTMAVTTDGTGYKGRVLIGLDL